MRPWLVLQLLATPAAGQFVPRPPPPPVRPPVLVAPVAPSAPLAPTAPQAPTRTPASGRTVSTAHAAPADPLPPPPQIRRPAADDDVDPAALICGGLALAGGGLAVVVWRGRQVVGRVRITGVPPGEAPDEVRAAWVGVELPLQRRHAHPRAVEGGGVLSGEPAGFESCYLFDAAASVAALGASSPTAADWWRTNTPHLLRRGGRLAFPVEVCDRVG